MNYHLKNQKKIFLSLFLVAILALPSVSFGQSAADLQTRIAELTKLIQQLQAQLLTVQSGGAQWCHTFNTNLRIGDSGSEVNALKTALAKEGLGEFSDQSAEFNEQVASAVSGFQEKYRSEILTPNRLQRGTGYVGPSTRKKLNQLYGCGAIGAIKVISPSSGEKLVQGKTYSIKWSGGDGTIGIQILDSSGNFVGWVTNKAKSSGEFSWDPASYEDYNPTVKISLRTGRYKLKIGTLNTDVSTLCGSAVKYPCRFLTSGLGDLFEVISPDETSNWQTYITPREMAKESSVFFKFQYPNEFKVLEGEYKTPGGARFPSFTIQKYGNTDKNETISIPGGMSTGPEITCANQAGPGDKCEKIKDSGYILVTKSRDLSVVAAFNQVLSTLEVKPYGNYTDEKDPVDSNPTDNYGFISGLIIDKESKKPIGGVEIIVKARPVKIVNGLPSFGSIDDAERQAVQVGTTKTNLEGRYSIRVPLGKDKTNWAGDINNFNGFMVYAKKIGYDDVLYGLVGVKDGQTLRLDFDLIFDIGPRG